MTVPALEDTYTRLADPEALLAAMGAPGLDGLNLIHGTLEAAARSA